MLRQTDARDAPVRRDGRRDRRWADHHVGIGADCQQALKSKARKERGPPFSGPKSLDGTPPGTTVQSHQSSKASGAL